MKKAILIFAILFATVATQAQTVGRFRTTALDTAAQQVNLGWTQISAINYAYPSTSIVYIKFYDSYAHAYAKAQKPVWTWQIGTDATIPQGIQPMYNLLKFTKGLWVRCTVGVTDTAQTATEPSTKPILEIQY